MRRKLNQNREETIQTITPLASELIACNRWARSSKKNSSFFVGVSPTQSFLVSGLTSAFTSGLASNFSSGFASDFASALGGTA